MGRVDLSPTFTHGFHDYREGIWGDSFSWASERSSNLVKWVVIHHTVTDHDATPDFIASLHKSRGWGGIGYHFVITKDGMVHYVGDLSTSRANVANQNDFVIGIALVGDFTKHLPSDEQIVAAHELCEYLISLPSFPNLKSRGWEALTGHKNLGQTACPGTSWPDDMRWRIQTGTVYTSTTPTPQPVPTPTPTPTPVPPPPGYGEAILELGKRVLALENAVSGLQLADQKRATQIKAVKTGIEMIDIPD